jgi:hypothetical protein
MIYIEPTIKDYHVFQVYDETEPDGEPYDPTVCACMTRAELVRAIDEIDMHTNAVMADEIDEDPSVES